MKRLAVWIPVAILSIVLFEGFTRAWEKFLFPTLRVEVKSSLTTDTTPFEPHPIYVFAPRPNDHLTESKWIDGKLAYSVEYEIDAHRRRRIPLPMIERKRDFVILFGCSYVFGHGLAAQDSLAGQIASRRTDLRPYVYGVNGYGPQQAWLQAKHIDFSTQITERKGRALYVFIDHHLQRLIGSMKFVNTWGATFPRLSVVDGKVVESGTFESAFPNRMRWYHRLNRYRTLQAMPVDLPMIQSKQDRRLMADVLLDMRDTLQQRENIELSVLIYPGSRATEPWLSLVRAGGVKVFDYSDIFSWKDEKYWIPVDHHPNAEAHRLVAERLAADWN